MAVSSYDEQYLSSDQQNEIASLTSQAESGDISWDDAHTAAEEVRATAGYSGGDDGSVYISDSGDGYNGTYTTSTGDGTGGSSSSSASSSSFEVTPFSYESAPTYTSKYQTQIDELLDTILNREDFSYDYTTDETYQQYADSYTENGKMAMQDTLGQVSSRTGGLASSYATSASQQTYDAYMSALADKIPELEALAYDMYLAEGDEQYDWMDLLMGMESMDYSMYSDTLSQYNTDRAFDYGVYSDELAQSNYENEWNYNVSQDELANSYYENEWNYGVAQDELAQENYENEWDYAVSQDELAQENYETEWDYAVDQDRLANSYYESETEYAQALTKAQTLASSGDFSGYYALGYTDSEIASMESAYAKAQAAASSSYSSGSSSSSSSVDSEDSTSTYALMKLAGATDYGTAYEWLVRNGYGTTNSKEMATYFAETWLSSGDDSTFDFYDSNADDIEKLLSGGTGNPVSIIDMAYNSGILTEAQAKALLAEYGIEV